MNRFMFFMVLVIYLVVATILADMLGLTTSGAITDGIGNDAAVGLGSIIRFFGTFVKMLTFQVQGLPVVITLIFFTAPLTVLIYILVDIIKDLIPFT